MVKKIATILPVLFLGIVSYSQHVPVDSTKKEIEKELAIDTSFNYDLLFQDMETFLDSILMPRSYLVSSVALGKGYYNFSSKSSVFLETTQSFTYTPFVGYFHKSGLSIAATGNVVNDNEKLNFYQAAISPGYDYIENRNFATGLTYTKFFTKDSLSFYTTPLQNELYAYFTYRKWWLKPSVALSYGWGSRSDYMEREVLINDLRLRRNGLVRINSKESISDFSILTSVRHDFYWLSIFSYKDHFRFTPQLTFVNGTQKFGFNQSANTYATVLRTSANVLYNSEDFYLDDELEFQPLALTLFLRSEYSIGKFFVQPQLIVDYYFPADEKNLSTFFSINLGMIF